MTFALTDILIDKIQSALENQEESFLVDAKNQTLISAEEVKADDENFYELPEWNSTDGFNLRQNFVNRLNSPFAKDELQQVLHSGRGVFKNFRNVLKQYPEVEKRWHVYKNREMNIFINEWYNSLREIWGLEKLDYFPESDENLIHDDFSFHNFTEEDSQIISKNIHASLIGEENNLPKELQISVFELWHNQFMNADAAMQTGFICRTLSEDFAGCITFSPVSDNQEKVFVLTSLFVPESYRGLGIGTELLSMCLSKLKADGREWLLLPNIIIPEILLPLLSRMGFEKLGTGYSLKISAS